MEFTIFVLVWAAIIAGQITVVAVVWDLWNNGVQVSYVWELKLCKKLRISCWSESRSIANWLYEGVEGYSKEKELAFYKKKEDEIKDLEIEIASLSQDLNEQYYEYGSVMEADNSRLIRLKHKKEEIEKELNEIPF